MTTEYTPAERQLISHEEALGHLLEEEIEQRFLAFCRGRQLRNTDLPKPSLREIALAFELERAVEERHQRRLDAAAREQQWRESLEDLATRPLKRQPLIMSKRDFEDILHYEEGLRMEKESLLVRRVIRNGSNRTCMGPAVASARELRRFGMDKKPAPTTTYKKRNRKSKR